jgi:hypothetical protein
VVNHYKECSEKTDNIELGEIYPPCIFLFHQMYC